jgi:hypothetical protein
LAAKEKGVPGFPETPLVNVPRSLVIQLQSELNLPRIVGSIAGRPDLAEGGLRAGIREVRRSRNGNDSVASESGSIEVGVVKDVKDFRPELQTETFG